MGKFDANSQGILNEINLNLTALSKENVKFKTKEKSTTKNTKSKKDQKKIIIITKKMNGNGKIHKKMGKSNFDF